MNTRFFGNVNLVQDGEHFSATLHHGMTLSNPQALIVQVWRDGSQLHLDIHCIDCNTIKVKSIFAMTVCVALVGVE
jgi:hypothetical protein